MCVCVRVYVRHTANRYVTVVLPRRYACVNVYVEAPVIRDRHRVLPLPLHEKENTERKKERKLIERKGRETKKHYADIMLIILIYYSVND